MSAVRLSVVADDLGLAPSVDAGIVRAHREGIVTSASWLAGGASAEAAVALVRRDAPALSVGLHLALSGVRPLTRGLDALCDAEGRLPARQFATIRWAWGRRRRRRAVRDEWEAQLARFRALWGRDPAHLDGHQHVHLAPPFADLVVELARDAGGISVRAAAEVDPHSRTRTTLEQRAFARLSRRLHRRARAAGLPTPDRFCGFAASGRVTASELVAMARDLRPGWTEWMVHPGGAVLADGYARVREQDALCAPRVCAALGSGVTLAAGPPEAAA